jgi:hypothetical protein
MDQTNNGDVADIFRTYGDEYRKIHQSEMPLHQLRVMRAIEICRTRELGGHVEQCDRCGRIRISYNSCRNRHCPQCQFLSKEKWVLEVNRYLLPIQYFHVVFSIPDLLNPLVLRNKKVMYDILFHSVARTLKELSENPDYLEARIGFISILVENDRVFFRYKDYACNNKMKIMVIDAFEFIRRFLLHVLPDRFVKIRYYGLLAQRNRKELLEECRALFGVVPEEINANEIPSDWHELYLMVTGEDLTICAFCGEGRMILKEEIPAKRYIRPP